MIPTPPISFKVPWHPVVDQSEWQGLQNELEKELSSVHPLWNTGATVFGRHQGCDDILVILTDGRYANVHLVWNGKVDNKPKEFPSTVIYNDITVLQKELNDESDDWD